MIMIKIIVPIIVIIIKIKTAKTTTTNTAVNTSAVNTLLMFIYILIPTNIDFLNVHFAKKILFNFVFVHVDILCCFEEIWQFIPNTRWHA